MTLEAVQLMMPDYGGTFTVIDLTDVLLAEQGYGTPPIRYLTQRGVYQHGATPIGMREDTRVVQVAVASELTSRLSQLSHKRNMLALANPLRHLNILTNTLSTGTLRRVLPGGDYVWIVDLVTTNGSFTVTSESARFVEWGMRVGLPIELLSGADAGVHTISRVVNDSELELSVALTATATGIEYGLYTGYIIRDLDILVSSGIAANAPRTVLTLSNQDVLQLTAHNPFWYNPYQQEVSWDLLLEDDDIVLYEVPNWTDHLVLPFVMGGGLITASSEVTYVGTWSSRPTIVLDGPFSYAKIENLTTGDSIVMQYDAIAGEAVTMDLSRLSIYNNFGDVDLLKYIATPYTNEDSDIVTFSLYPHPLVLDGKNAMTVTMDDVGEGSAVTLYWKSRYNGIQV